MIVAITWVGVSVAALMSLAFVAARKCAAGHVTTVSRESFAHTGLFAAHPSAH